MLKWPLCVGEAEQVVLAELEKQLTKEFKRPISFGGDAWKFAEQAGSLGISNLDAPAIRPSAEEVLKELKTLSQRTKEAGKKGDVNVLR